VADRGAALVTGAARRIGRALALKAASCGYDVAIHCRHSVDEAKDLAASIERDGRRTAVLTADLADEAECARLVADAAAALGPLGLLVNNASLFEEDAAETMTAASFDLHIATNLRAPLLLSQAFASQAPRGSLIVNILDQRVWRPTPQFFSYAISKAGLWHATRTLAQALAPDIRVNGIGPGPTLASIHQSNADFEAEARGVPLQHHATPEEIAGALGFLIDAPSVTGQMIAVDAGQHLAWRTPDVVAR
jgi:NAD(P)-dependent dehydrogenase (short-subunit alcohol dehydrogenase family)